MMKRSLSVILSAAPVLSVAEGKDLMPVASGDEVPSATLRAGLRCAQDDKT
jgi:hypothetical protein